MKQLERYMEQFYPDALLQVRHIVSSQEIQARKSVDVDKLVKYELCKQIAEALFDRDAIEESQVIDTKVFNLKVVTLKRGQLSQIVKELIQTMTLDEIEKIRNPER